MIVLKGGTLIDGTGGAPVRDATIVVDDGRIERVTTGATGPDRRAPRSSTSPAARCCRDSSTATTIWPPTATTSPPAGSSTSRRARGTCAPAGCSSTLDFGYTTIRDAGGLDAGFRAAVDEGLVRGPRLLTAVAIISPIGGIGDRVSPSGHECMVSADPALPRGVANGVEDVRRVVRTMVRAGADVIKCATTGGASSRAGHGPRDAAFDLDEMRALVDESHALGRRVMCHALGGPGLRMALEAGVDSIEHGCYLDEDPELIPMMAERGTFLVPTLTVYVYHSESKAPHVRERARALREHHLDTIRRAMAAGVKVVAGTDAGGHGHPPNAMEIEYLVAAGLTPMQAIQAATGWAAECLGLEHQIGAVEKGRRADLVVVDGDPLADVRLLQLPSGSGSC